MLNLSKRITSETDYRVLVINGLRLEEHIVDGHFNTEKTVQAAAQKCLKEWRKAQTNSRIAHSRLCHILRSCQVGMNLMVATVLTERHCDRSN